MGRVRRRTAIKGAALWAGAAALGACTISHPPEVQPTPTTARPATTAPVAPPTGRAPSTTFPVHTEKLKLARGADRPLPTTIWRPAAEGTYPLVLFSHGLNATPEGYDDLLTPWARAGFIVAAPTYPYTSAGASQFNAVDVLNQPGDASYVITQVTQRLGAGVGPIGAAGHSAGGVTTRGLFSGRRDARLRAGVVLSGRQIIKTPLTGAATPLLFVHGTRDETVAYADGHAVYDAVTWPKAFLTVTGGGHVPTGAELDVVAVTSTDFLRWSLYGDPAARKRLPADATRGDLATLESRL